MFIPMIDKNLGRICWYIKGDHCWPSPSPSPPLVRSET